MTNKKNNDLIILNTKISLGESKEILFDVAKLHTSSSVNVPIIVERSKKPGPIVLFTAGIHGDEVNGVEIIRQLIEKEINKPKCGTIICMPVINIFGFINLKREFPDGRDLNRVFPGTSDGSLASQVAHKLTSEIIPHVDYILDFHTGGSDRFNAPQIRITKDNKQLNDLAKIFAPPFVLYSKNLNKSFRNTCYKLEKPLLLFEGGKSFHINKNVTSHGINGVKRILHYLKMLDSKFKITKPKTETIFINESRWQRASFSGMFRASTTIGALVEKGDTLGNITDPFGKVNFFIKARNTGYIININESPIVYQGDAIFHISTKLKAKQGD